MSPSGCTVLSQIPDSPLLFENKKKELLGGVIKTPILGLWPGRGGEHLGTEGGRTQFSYFAEEGVLFKTSACPRFCKRRVLFCTQVRSMGGENPLTIHKIYAAPMTPEVIGLPSLLPPLAAAEQAEDYKILS